MTKLKMIKSGKTLGRSISMSLTVNVPVYVLYDTVVRGTRLQTDQLSTKTALQVPTLQNCCDADPYELLYGPRSKSWIWKFSIRIQVKQNNQFLIKCMNAKKEMLCKFNFAFEFTRIFY